MCSKRVAMCACSSKDVENFVLKREKFGEVTTPSVCVHEVSGSNLGPVSSALSCLVALLIPFREVPR